MNEYKQRVVDFFDRRTAYDAEGDSHPHEAKRLLEFAPLKTGQTILDLATGTGLVAIAAAEQVAPMGSVVGVDMSSGMLSQARSKISDRSITNLVLIEADIEAVSFQPEQFNLIFCCSAMVYISDIPALLSKCHSWLKPGGYLAFSTRAKSAYNAGLQVQLSQELFGIDFPHILRPLWTPEACEALLKQAKFKDIEVESDRRGEYVVEDNYTVDIQWADNHLSPQGNPLVNLTDAQKQQLQKAYQKAINERVTAQGLWRDRSALYVKARKLGGSPGRLWDGYI
ncbi:MAG: methyltransferase domain-containing protein [Cyanobacteria bacterium J06588_4]